MASDAQIQHIFAVFDQKGAGRIDSTQFSEAMSALGVNLSKEQVASLLQDSEGQTVDLATFTEYAKKLTRPVSDDQEIRDIFKAFDRDGDGLITADEIKRSLNELGETLTDEDVNEMIRVADVNGDGKVNYEEFIVMMSLK